MNKSTLVLILVGALAFLYVSDNFPLYRVMETQRAVKLQFGRMVDPNIKPGLHVKIPFAQQVVKFDARVLTLDAPAESFYTLEKKRLIVDSFVKWRIADVDHYYRATGGDESLAMSRLAARVNDGLRNEFGRRNLHEVVSGERDELMLAMTTRLNKSAQESLGIEVLDVRVKKIDFPPEVSQKVFDRMKTDREKEARQYRSQGREEAEKIRADADRQKVVIEADAYKQAELLRGDGDARAASVYASAYNKDPEFYAFVRSLEAYKKSFANKGDVLLVKPDSEFFRYLKDSEAKK